LEQGNDGFLAFIFCLVCGILSDAECYFTGENLRRALFNCFHLSNRILAASSLGRIARAK